MTCVEYLIVTTLFAPIKSQYRNKYFIAAPKTHVTWIMNGLLSAALALAWYVWKITEFVHLVGKSQGCDEALTIYMYVMFILPSVMLMSSILTSVFLVKYGPLRDQSTLKNIYTSSYSNHEIGCMNHSQISGYETTVYTVNYITYSWYCYSCSQPI